MLMTVYEQLFDHLFPMLLLSNMNLDPLMLRRLLQIAVAKCEELQQLMKEKTDAVAQLGAQPAIPAVDNKKNCKDCHMQRSGGPPPGFNMDNVEYTSSSRTLQHPSWCPGVCNLAYCTRKHGECADAAAFIAFDVCRLILLYAPRSAPRDARRTSSGALPSGARRTQGVRGEAREGEASSASDLGLREAAHRLDTRQDAPGEARH